MRICILNHSDSLWGSCRLEWLTPLLPLWLATPVIASLPLTRDRSRVLVASMIYILSRDGVCKTCDAVDDNIKGMYQLMAKWEELNKAMTPAYK